MIKLNENIKLHRADCMEVMATYPDGYFDLAVVDPPYGLSVVKDGETSKEWGVSKSKGFSFRAKKYKEKMWDEKAPDEEYFSQLKRVSRRQIIWGGNLMGLPMNSYIVWYKKGKSNNPKYSDTELAYLSFNAVPKLVDIWWNGFGSINSGEHRIHPTQKPVALYAWILKNYSEPGQKILDTHLGSGSSAIAAHYFGVGEFVGCELDQEYFEAAVKRIKAQTAQIAMF